jgi:hypothetical protein
MDFCGLETHTPPPPDEVEACSPCTNTTECGPFNRLAARIKGTPSLVGFSSRAAGRNTTEPNRRPPPRSRAEERTWRRRREPRRGRRRWSPGSTPSTSTSASTAGTSPPYRYLAAFCCPLCSVTRNEIWIVRAVLGALPMLVRRYEMFASW